MERNIGLCAFYMPSKKLTIQKLKFDFADCCHSQIVFLKIGYKLAFYFVGLRMHLDTLAIQKGCTPRMHLYSCLAKWRGCTKESSHAVFARKVLLPDDTGTDNSHSLRNKTVYNRLNTAE